MHDCRDLCNQFELIGSLGEYVSNCSDRRTSTAASFRLLLEMRLKSHLSDTHKSCGDFENIYYHRHNYLLRSIKRQQFSRA